MAALIGFLISNPLVLALIASILGGLGFGVHQRFAGAKAERDKQAAAENAAVNSASQVQNQVDQLKPDDARKDLGKWSRS